MAKVTVQDIALALGVSTATVSMALHGKPGVSDRVRQTVIEKAAEMGYVVRERAPRRLSAVQTPVLLTVRENGVEYDRQQFFLELLQELEKEAGGLLLRAVDLPDDNNIDTVREKLAEISAQASYLVLLATSLDPRSLKTILSMLSCPVIVFDQNCWWLPVHSVAIDNAGSIMDGVSHYYAAGERSFGFLTCQHGGKIYNMEERATGFGAAMKRLGLTADGISVPASESSEQEKRDFCAAIKPGVWFSQQDSAALLAHQYLQTYAPEKLGSITLVGYDDFGTLRNLPGSHASFRLNRDAMAKAVVGMGTALAGVNVNSGRTSPAMHLLIRSTLVTY